MSDKEELSNENLCASFLVRMEDVTDSIIPFLSDTLKESARADKIKDLTAKMKKRAGENGKYEVSVKAFYGGNEYYLFVFKTYKDVRPRAPPSQLENSGATRTTGCGPGIPAILLYFGSMLIHPEILLPTVRKISR